MKQEDFNELFNEKENNFIYDNSNAVIEEDESDFVKDEIPIIYEKNDNIDLNEFLIIKSTITINIKIFNY